MLKQVHDKVIQASNIVQAFSAHGMHPFDFTASYTYKQVPPKMADSEDEWTDSESGNNSGMESSHAAKKKDILAIVTTGSGSQCPLHSTPHSKSQDNSCLSTPGPQICHIHAECLRGIDTCLVALSLDATPCCVADLHKETVEATHCDAAHDASTATLVNIIKLQTQIIKRQNAQHIMDTQLHNHLKTQLTNRSHPCKHTGTAFKHRYGALDAQALDALEAEAAGKQVEEEEK